MRSLVLVAARFAVLAAALSTQPFAMAADATPAPLAPLPSPAVPEGARPSDYLRAAQNALAAGRAGEAEEALEMAQTRMLDRSVPLGQTNNPSDNPTIGQISQARQALAARDRATCLQLIQAAIGSATAQGL